MFYSLFVVGLCMGVERVMKENKKIIMVVFVRYCNG